MVVVREAMAADWDGIRALLPQLASFEIPGRRNPEDLWRGDEKALLTWLEGLDPDGFAYVAVEQGGIVGVVFARMGTDSLSGQLNAHLEVLAVAEAAQRRGIATALVGAAEQAKAVGSWRLRTQVASGRLLAV